MPPTSSRAQLSSLIKSARDIMRKDAGLNGDLDRLPQLSWMLFLKCYDDLEGHREDDAIVSHKPFKPVIPAPYRWRDWASDPDKGATGEDLINFINNDLLPSIARSLGFRRAPEDRRAVQRDLQPHVERLPVPGCAQPGGRDPLPVEGRDLHALAPVRVDAQGDARRRRGLAASSTHPGR